MDDELEQLAELTASIRYQVNRPPVTKMGNCPKCGEGSRGASECADCLGAKIDNIVGSDVGTRYVARMRRLHADAARLAAAREAAEEDGENA